MYPNLKLQLWKMGMRQNRLAKSLGMDETILSKIVNGYREPSTEIRRKIAVLLNREESWLFDESDGSRTLSDKVDNAGSEPA